LTTEGGVQYSKIAEIKGPLVVVDDVENAAFDELVEIETNEGERRLGKVLEVGNGKAIVQVFEGTTGLSISGTNAKFVGKVMEMPVSKEVLGRVFDGLGRPKDGLPDPIADKFIDINGEPMNPEQREYPKDFIQTGVSVIDGLITLVRGQKLPIFSGSGMSHNLLAAQIARQASVVGTNDDFAVVFAAIGVQYSEAEYFRRSLEESGALKRSVLFLNTADDPAIERIITPRVALTVAEYLAFEKLPEVVLGDLAQDPQLLGRTAATAFKKFLSDHADLKELAEEALINAWNKVKLGKLEQTKAVSHAEKILTQGNQETASTSVVKKIEYAGKVAGNIKFNDKQLKVSLNISSIDNASLDKLEILLKELVERNEKV